MALGSALLLRGAPARADEAPVREYIVDERLPPASTSWKIVVGGLGATAAFYGLAQPFSYAWPDSPGSLYLRYPVVGPWMALGANTCPDIDPECSLAWRVFKGFLQTLDGLGQAGGLAVAVEGLFVPVSHEPEGVPHKRKPRPRVPASEQPENAPGNLFYLPKPMVVGQRGIGLGIMGVF